MSYVIVNHNLTSLDIDTLITKLTTRNNSFINSNTRISTLVNNCNIFYSYNYEHDLAEVDIYSNDWYAKGTAFIGTLEELQLRLNTVDNFKVMVFDKNNKPVTVSTDLWDEVTAEERIQQHNNKAPDSMQITDAEKEIIVAARNKTTH